MAKLPELTLGENENHSLRQLAEHKLLCLFIFLANLPKMFVVETL